MPCAACCLCCPCLCCPCLCCLCLLLPVPVLPCAACACCCLCLLLPVPVLPCAARACAARACAACACAARACAARACAARACAARACCCPCLCCPVLPVPVLPVPVLPVPVLPVPVLPVPAAARACAALCCLCLCCPCLCCPVPVLPVPVLPVPVLPVPAAARACAACACAARACAARACAARACAARACCCPCLCCPVLPVPVLPVPVLPVPVLPVPVLPVPAAARACAALCCLCLCCPCLCCPVPVLPVPVLPVPVAARACAALCCLCLLLPVPVLPVPVLPVPVLPVPVLPVPVAARACAALCCPCLCCPVLHVPGAARASSLRPRALCYCLRPRAHCFCSPPPPVCGAVTVTRGSQRQPAPKDPAWCVDVSPMTVHHASALLVAAMAALLLCPAALPAAADASVVFRSSRSLCLLALPQSWFSGAQQAERSLVEQAEGGAGVVQGPTDMSGAGEAPGGSGATDQGPTGGAGEVVANHGPPDTGAGGVGGAGASEGLADAGGGGSAETNQGPTDAGQPDAAAAHGGNRAEPSSGVRMRDLVVWQAAKFQLKAREAQGHMAAGKAAAAVAHSRASALENATGAEDWSGMAHSCGDQMALVSESVEEAAGMMESGGEDVNLPRIHLSNAVTLALDCAEGFDLFAPGSSSDPRVKALQVRAPPLLLLAAHGTTACRRLIDLPLSIIRKVLMVMLHAAVLVCVQEAAMDARASVMEALGRAADMADMIAAGDNTAAAATAVPSPSPTRRRLLQTTGAGTGTATSVADPHNSIPDTSTTGTLGSTTGNPGIMPGSGSDTSANNTAGDGSGNFTTVQVRVREYANACVCLQESRIFPHRVPFLTACLGLALTACHSSLPWGEQAAIRAYPPGFRGRFVVFIRPGFYREKVAINSTCKNVTLLGLGASSTVISWLDNATAGIGTFQTPTVAVDASGFAAIGIRFENTAGKAGNQAVAFRQTGDNAAFYECEFLGWQDTLYVHGGRQYYRNCYVNGTVDFVFGNGAAVLENCTFVIRSHSNAPLTASGRTNYTENTGIVILNSVIKGDLVNKTYLGRPWRPYARVAVINTTISNVVRSPLPPSLPLFVLQSPFLPCHDHCTGWLDWGGVVYNTSTFIEQGNSGPGSVGPRIAWAAPGIVTDPAQVAMYYPNSFLAPFSTIANLIPFPWL
ncbi:unnamed protein product [Closterium sp. NIES-64]|nr:unnamed protein product [Closterium sp. NIES-64]